MMRAIIIIHPTRPCDNALLQRLLRAGDDGVIQISATELEPTKGDEAYALGCC
jgi:hypothetical protein